MDPATALASKDPATPAAPRSLPERPRRARRRPDRRCRPLRHRRCLPSALPIARQDLRDPRGARRDRRHVGPLPVSGHPVGLRHVHARLRLPPVAGGEGDRGRPFDPQLHPRDRPRERHRTAHSLQPPRGARRLVERRRALDRARPQRTDTGETVRAHVLRSSSAAPATTATTRATRRSSRARERFKGEIIHPQHWPEDLDYTGKRVVIIGSGATAVTLVPAMAERAAHVTMLQRSPSYVVSLPGQRRRSPTSCAASCPRSSPIRSCAGRTSRSRRSSSARAGAGRSS